MCNIRASGGGAGAGERPLARHLQAYFRAYFQLTGREPEQNPSWYLPATAPRQCQAGIRHRNLLLPARAATTNQRGPEFWAPAQIPVLAQLQFPSLISCLKSLGQSTGAGTEGLLPGGREAAFRLRVPRDGISGFPISIPATEPRSAGPGRGTHACNCTIKPCVNSAILSRRKQQLPTIPRGLKDQCAFRQ